MSEFEQLRALLSEHVPDADVSDVKELEFSKESVFDRHAFDVVVAEAEKQHLKVLSEGCRKSLLALRSLHPTLKRNLEHDFAKSKRDTDIRFFSGDQPYQSYRQIEQMLEHLVEGLHGTLADGKQILKDAPLESARLHASQMPELTDQQALHNSWEKVRLVNLAREVWGLHSNKSAPNVPSAGSPFLDFVDALIAHYGLDWDAESTVRSWNKQKDRADSWGWKNR